MFGLVVADDASELRRFAALVANMPVERSLLSVALVTNATTVEHWRGWK